MSVRKIEIKAGVCRIYTPDNRIGAWFFIDKPDNSCWCYDNKILRSNLFKNLRRLYNKTRVYDILGDRIYEDKV